MQGSSRASVCTQSAPLPPASERAMSTWAGRKDHASTLNFFSLLFQCLISTTTFASAGAIFDQNHCHPSRPSFAAIAADAQESIPSAATLHCCCCSGRDDYV